MLISQSIINLPRFRVLRPRFNKTVLTNTDKTEIAWYNIGDHNQPFPYDFSACSGLEFHFRTDRMDTPNAVPVILPSNYPTRINYTAPTTNVGAGDSLMMVDSAGADLFDLFQPALTRPASAYGMYFKQDPPNGRITVTSLAGFIIPLIFRDDVGNIISPPF